MKTFLGAAVFLVLLAFSECHYTANEIATVDRIKEGFGATGLVPSLIPSFEPQGVLVLRFEDEAVLRHPNQKIKASALRARPIVNLFPSRFGELHDNQKFTLVMFNADYPPQTNSSGGKLHMLGTKISLRRQIQPVEVYVLVNETSFTVEYRAPDSNELSNPGRYIVLLYKGVPSPSALEDFKDPNGDYNNFNLSHITLESEMSPAPFTGAIFEVENNLEAG
ncbi:hypothetical protein BY996DRAFT_6412023 [Phakopsora pachyrhizi]|uniref:Expressed protein n=1 Tax=Phakopsora pachyrhizi TaxID=170000 RepID=A0AAV0BTH5_PHAPC|nr:hypothetical protein BY996DRAFT_6412023 [Phakopsora pachyrhizi]CAH7690680.1 expressed protein [Phakopsora pachyrhizi]